MIFIPMYFKLTWTNEQPSMVLPLEDGPITKPLSALYHLQWMNSHANDFFYTANEKHR